MVGIRIINPAETASGSRDPESMSIVKIKRADSTSRQPVRGPEQREAAGCVASDRATEPDPDVA